MAVQFQQVPSPCYVLDEQLLRRNLQLISQVRDKSGVEIIMALKGFAMWSAFPVCKEYGFSYATASSPAEARLAFEELGNKAHTYAPAYSQSDIDTLIPLSSHITFNSLSMYQQFGAQVRSAGVSCGLRVNPEYSEVTTELYNPCAPGTRLGLTVDKLIDGLPEGIEGLHFHALCESYSTDLEKTLAAFEERFGAFIPQLKWVNFGGGHLMTRKGYDVEHLISLLKAFKQKWGVHVILEPGAAFAWETGYLVASVLDVVENKGIKTAILNVSFTAHMPDCLEMPYKPVILGATEPVEGKPTYRMGGNSCLSGDYMGFWSFDNELKIGDQLVFNDMIHYTMVKTTTFNGVTHPSIGIWNDATGFKLIRSFGYEDYKNRLS